MKRFSSGMAGRALGVVLFIIVVAAAAAAGWYFFVRSTPEKTVRQFMAASDANDVEAIKPLLSSRSREAMSRMESLLPQGAKEKGPQTDYELGKARINGDKATVPMIVKLPEKASKLMSMAELTITWGLVKENGKWVIDMGETMKAMAGNLLGPERTPK